MAAMATKVTTTLREINATDGVHETLVVGRDGFVIEHVGDMNADEVGAILSTSIGAVESMGRDANQGRLEELMAEFADGTVLLAPIGTEAVLGVVAGHGANLGRIRYEVKKRLRDLERGL
jgi:uncharacterized protein